MPKGSREGILCRGTKIGADNQSATSARRGSLSPLFVQSGECEGEREPDKKPLDCGGSEIGAGAGLVDVAAREDSSDKWDGFQSPKKVRDADVPKEVRVKRRRLGHDKPTHDSPDERRDRGEMKVEAVSSSTLNLVHSRVH